VPRLSSPAPLFRLFRLDPSHPAPTRAKPARDSLPLSVCRRLAFRYLRNGSRPVPPMRCSNDARADAIDKAAFDAAAALGDTHFPPVALGPAEITSDSPVKRRRGAAAEPAPSSGSSACSVVWLVTMEERASASAEAQWRTVGCFSSKEAALRRARIAIGENTAVRGITSDDSNSAVCGDHVQNLGDGGTVHSVEGAGGAYAKVVLAKLQVE
jgi:hypothetical protein